MIRKTPKFDSKDLWNGSSLGTPHGTITCFLCMSKRRTVINSAEQCLLSNVPFSKLNSVDAPTSVKACMFTRRSFHIRIPNSNTLLITDCPTSEDRPRGIIVVLLKAHHSFSLVASTISFSFCLTQLPVSVCFIQIDPRKPNRELCRVSICL